MLHNSKYSPTFDRDEYWDTCAISEYDIGRVQVGVLRISGSIAAEDNATFSARDRGEEEVDSRENHP